jgi:hypothetical protein
LNLDEREQARKEARDRMGGGLGRLGGKGLSLRDARREDSLKEDREPIGGRRQGRRSGLRKLERSKKPG